MCSKSVKCRLDTTNSLTYMHCDILFGFALALKTSQSNFRHNFACVCTCVQFWFDLLGFTSFQHSFSRITTISDCERANSMLIVRVLPL